MHHVVFLDRAILPVPLRRPDWEEVGGSVAGIGREGMTISQETNAIIENKARKMRRNLEDMACSFREKHKSGQPTCDGAGR